MGRKNNRKVKGADLKALDICNPRGLSEKSSVCVWGGVGDGGGRFWKEDTKESWKLFNEIIFMASSASCFTVEERRVTQ